MLEIEQTAIFTRWLEQLRDRHARIRIAARIDRVSYGHFGDCAPVGDGINELRFFIGPGYRVYYLQRGNLITLLCGGDKDSQHKDVVQARELARLLAE